MNKIFWIDSYHTTASIWGDIENLIVYGPGQSALNNPAWERKGLDGQDDLKRFRST